MKPSIPKGTRDFSPQEMVRRNYIFDTIKQVFQLYGFLPIETPAMENMETLMGKYGEEGDRLIFKILNSGDYLEKSKIQSPKFEELDYKKFTSEISEKALRYDLTVPFARYVVQHQNEITFPFKRYQIQPVWRADRPQKGRYREFYQCDADVIGSNSLVNEVELVQIMDEVFRRLNIPVIIKFNNRKILNGIVELAGISLDKINFILEAIDEFDKINRDIALDKLIDKGFNEEQINKLKNILYQLMDDVHPNMDDLTENVFIKALDKIFYQKSEIGSKGVIEINEINKVLKLLFGNRIHMMSGLISKEPSQSYNINVKQEDRIYLHNDISLARGLNYYTGSIFEVKVDKSRCKSEFTSSICGGGRYDDLTGIFGLPNVSGVGISFGADRIYDVLNELNLFPESVSASTKLLFVTFGETEQNYCLPLLAKVRKAGINSEIYPDAKAKMKKQMSYADDKKIPFVAIVGSDEMNNGLLSLKNMTSGEQTKATIDTIIETLK